MELCLQGFWVQCLTLPQCARAPVGVTPRQVLSTYSVTQSQGGGVTGCLSAASSGGLFVGLTEVYAQQCFGDPNMRRIWSEGQVTLLKLWGARSGLPGDYVLLWKSKAFEP